MGSKLMEFYDLAKKRKGLVGRMRLAIKTGIPPEKASKIEDSPTIIESFKKSLIDIGVKI